MQYTKRYGHIIYSNDLTELQSLSDNVQDLALKALTLLSKYLGNYREFKARLDQHGIKWQRPDALTAFLRILNSNNKDTRQWLANALPYLRPNEQVFAKFLQLSGLRVSEGIASFNLCVELSEKNKLHEYYDSELSCLCHFKYPKTFVRRTKSAYITFIQTELLDTICNSQPVSYSAILRRLRSNNISTRFNELRDQFGTHLVNNGVLEIEQNLVCGRIPVNIFIRHYWSPKLKDLGSRIFKALETIDVQQQTTTNSQH